MRLKLWLFLSVVCLAGLGIGGGIHWNIVRAEVPKPDFENLAGYQRALEVSTNPTSHAILRQIMAGPSALARERAAAQSEGILLDAAQLQRPLPPASENAAPLYEKWHTQMRKEAFVLPPYAEFLKPGYAYTPEQIAVVQKILDDHPDVVALLHQAADKPQCVMVEQWKDIATQGIPFSGSTQLREAAREINTESFLLAKQGRYSEAIADQSRGFRIAEHSASAPTIISYLVGVAIEAITLRGMEDVLDLAGTNQDVAQQVQQAVAAHHSRLSLKYALSGEVAVTLSYMDALSKSSPADLSSYVNDDYDQKTDWDKAQHFSPEEQQFLAELIDAVEADYIHQMRRLVAAADGPPAVCDSVFADVPDYTASPLNPVDLITDKELVVYGLLDKHENIRRGEDQCVMAGAAALDARSRTGVFPAHLPGDFRDPYCDDQPLKYRREGTGGFVVYSVGPTGKFDGGKPGEHHWTPFEIAFRYPGPTPQPVPADLLK